MKSGVFDSEWCTERVIGFEQFLKSEIRKKSLRFFIGKEREGFCKDTTDSTLCMELMSPELVKALGCLKVEKSEKAEGFVFEEIGEDDKTKIWRRS